MKPATHAIACSASTSELRKSTWPTAPRSAGSLTPATTYPLGSGVTRWAMSHTAASSATAIATAPRTHGRSTGRRRAVPAAQRGARVIHALGEGELADVHPVSIRPEDRAP